MKNFEDKMRELFASKLLTEATDVVLVPKESLEVLLEHVCKKVLAPAHYILAEQEQFSLSSLESYTEGSFGDAVGDGMEDRPLAVLRIVRLQEPLFEYWLSFDGDHKSAEASLWRKVHIIRTSGFDLNNPPADLFDFLDSSGPVIIDKCPAKTSLDENAIKSVEEYVTFPTLDMNEAVRHIQQDLYMVCNTLL